MSHEADGPRPTTPEPAPFVPVRSYSDSIQANLARSVLESADIPTTLWDEHIVNTDWFYNGVVGGVKLLVPADRKAEAHALLAEVTESPKSGGRLTGYRCPECDATEVKLAGFGRRLAWLVVALFGIPLPWSSVECESCGHGWRPEKRGRG